MIPQNLKIVELKNVEGEPAGLYLTQRDDIENFQRDFDVVFDEGMDILMDGKEDDDWDIRTYVDKKLSDTYDLHREWAEEVTTETI
jgi:hypothetical protein